MVRGRVLAKPTLHPVAEAKVTVVPVNDSYAPVTAFTDAYGNFVVGPVGPDRSFRFNLAANGNEGGYTVLSEEVHVEGAPLDVEVGPTQTIRGRAVVLGPDGSEAPAAGVRLAVHAYASWTAGIWYAGPHAGQRVTTGEDGSFEIGGVSVEKAVVSVDEAETRYSIDPTTPQDGGGIMLKGKQDDVVAIPLVKRRSVSGVVLDGAGARVEGAEVSSNWTRLRARTDENGEFRLRAIPPRTGGKLVLSAHARGLGSGTEEFADGVPDAPIEVVLRPVVPIEGVVRDGDGNPLAQVRVTTEPYRLTGNGLAYTDEEGRYRLGWHGEERPRAAFVLHGFQVEVSDLANPPEPVVLIPALSMSGIVRDEQGDPVANVYLRATQAGDGAKSARNRTAQSDGEGRFSIEDLSAGSWHLNAWAEGYLSPAHRLVALSAETGDLTLTVERVLEIRGRVVDIEGKPVAKARVDARHSQQRRGAGTRAETWSDRNGEFRIAGIRDGAFLLRAWASRRVFDSIEGVQAGTDRVLLQAVPPVTLAGRVILPEGADPKAAVVHLFREDRSLRPASVRSWSDPGPLRFSCDREGRWKAEWLVGPSFTVWVEHPELAAPLRRGVKGGSVDVEFRLGGGATIEGTVAGNEGPITVRAEAMDGRGPTRSVAADESGRFRLAGLAYGVKYRLGAWNSEWTWKAEREAVEPGASGVVLHLVPVEERDD